ncbi:chorismate mutase [Aliikangiella coralliicola]|uniref:chorismate mutase n=1 Tax=Aliikangiella coralliicola TaxID=2592383 RepID=UPI00143CCECC|nr:chorismate mutase [Aliikangiella coralliicola]
MKNIMLSLFLISIFSLQASAENISKELFKAMNERLSYMEDVALFKANHHRPIEDIEREKLVIKKAVITARSLGIEATQIENFFQAQIAVAKAIQYRYRADLLSKPTTRKPKDLQKFVRPELVQLGETIINKIAARIKSEGQFQPTQFSEFSEIIDVKYVSQSDKRLLFDALLKIKLQTKKSAVRSNS